MGAVDHRRDLRMERRLYPEVSAAAPFASSCEAQRSGCTVTISRPTVRPPRICPSCLAMPCRFPTRRCRRLRCVLRQPPGVGPAVLQDDPQPQGAWVVARLDGVLGRWHLRRHAWVSAAAPFSVSFRTSSSTCAGHSFWAQDFNHMDQLSKDGSGFVKAGYKGIQLPTHFSPCAPTIPSRTVRNCQLRLEP